MLKSIEPKLNILIEQRREKFRRSIRVQLKNNMNTLRKIEVVLHYGEENYLPLFEEILKDIDKTVIEEILDEYSNNGFIINISDNNHFKRMKVEFKKGEE